MTVVTASSDRNHSPLFREAGLSRDVVQTVVVVKLRHYTHNAPNRVLSLMAC